MGLFPISAATTADTEHLSALRFLELTADIAGAMDFDGRITGANPALARLLGTSPEALVGRHTIDIVHPDDRVGFGAVADELMGGARAMVELELRFGSSDGGWRWFLTSIAVDRAAGLLYGIGKDVTDRRENEERLRDAEERFRSAFEHAAIGKAITSLDGRFVRVNRALAQLVGRDQEELTGMAVLDVTHPDHRERDGEAIRRLCTGEIASYQVEKRYLTPDGASVWVALSVAVVRGSDGAPQYFLSQMVDIGERRAAERALADSERRFRALASASPAGIFAADPRGEMHYANDRLAEILGLGPDELDGFDWLRRIEPEGRRRLGEATRRARGDEDRVTVEVRLRAGRAGARWVRIHLANAEVGGLEGERRRLIGTVDDVSARLEERQELTRREAEYRMLAEHSGDFLSRHALDGTYLYASPVCESLLGYAAHHLVGRSLDELELVHEEDRAAVDALFAAALAGGGLESQTGTYRIIRRNGGSAGSRPPCASYPIPTAGRASSSPCRATSPSAAPPSASWPTGRCTTSSPGCPTAPCSWIASTRRCCGRRDARARWPCCSATSTASSSSTTRSATVRATGCCATSRPGCAKRCAPPTRWRASAVTS